MVVSVVVVVVVVVLPEELELLDESSFFAQEMMVRLKNVDRKRNKIFFIFSPIPKEYYCLLKKQLCFITNLQIIKECVDFSWRASDCEELVGVFLRG